MYPASAPYFPQTRVAVDNDSAALFAGTSFRAMFELNIAAGASAVVRLDRACDIVIRKFSVALTAGEIRGEIWTGATPAGSWSNLPVIPRNLMSRRPAPAYATKSTVSTGGTISGGTLIDLLLLKVASASGQASPVSGIGADEYATAAGTGFYKFTNTGNSTTTGVFVILWDELPTS